MRWIRIAVVFLVAGGGAALADQVELRSGVVLDGEATTVGDDVHVVLPSGGRMTVPRSLVKSVRQDGAAPVAFEAATPPPPAYPLPSPGPAAGASSAAASPAAAPLPAAPLASRTYGPSSPPPPPPPPSVPGAVYERQGLPPLTVGAPAPAPSAAPCPPPCPPDPCDPCPPDPCDPCPDLGPWSIDLNLSWTQAGGNSDSLAFKVDFEVVYERKPWKWVTKGLYAYAESGDSVDTNRVFAESQIDYQLTNCDYVFVNGSYDRDEPADLDYRVIANAGYGRSIVKQENLTLDLEVGGGGTWEKRTNRSETLDPSAYVGVDFMRDFGRGGKFTFDYDFLPNLDDFDLSLMRFDAKYTVPCLGCLNFVLGLRVDYQIEPEDPTVDEVDWIASAGLGITF